MERQRQRNFIRIAPPIFLRNRRNTLSQNSTMASQDSSKLLNRSQQSLVQFFSRLSSIRHQNSGQDSKQKNLHSHVLEISSVVKKNNQLDQPVAKWQLIILLQIIDERFQSFTEELKKINRKFDEIEGKINERFNNIDEGFNNIDERFNNIDERFNRLEEKFKKIDRKFEEIEGNINERFNRLEETLSKVHQKYVNYEKLFSNSVQSITTNQKQLNKKEDQKYKKIQEISQFEYGMSIRKKIEESQEIFEKQDSNRQKNKSLMKSRKMAMTPEKKNNHPKNQSKSSSASKNIQSGLKKSKNEMNRNSSKKTLVIGVSPVQKRKK